MPIESTPGSRLVRLGEFCRQGNISRSTAYAWIAAGKLKSLSVGSMAFVTETFEQNIERRDAERKASMPKRPPPPPKRPRGRPRKIRPPEEAEAGE